MLLGMVRGALGILFAAFGFVSWTTQIDAAITWTIGGAFGLLAMMFLAGLTVFAERDQIGASNKELLAYVLSFPIYMASYIPISFQAVFSRAQWKPIEHKG